MPIKSRTCSVDFFYAPDDDTCYSYILPGCQPDRLIPTEQLVYCQYKVITISYCSVMSSTALLTIGFASLMIWKYWLMSQRSRAISALS